MRHSLLGIEQHGAGAQYIRLWTWPHWPPLSRALGSAYRLFYDEPLELVRGDGAWLFEPGDTHGGGGRIPEEDRHLIFGRPETVTPKTTSARSSIRARSKAQAPCTRVASVN